MPAPDQNLPKPALLGLFLGELVWALAAGAFSWGSASVAGVIASSVGALAGVLAAQWAVPAVHGWRLHGWRWGTFLGIALILVGIALIPRVLAPGIVAWFSTSPLTFAVVTEMADWLPKMFVLAFIVRLLALLCSLFRAVEAILTGLMTISFLAAHSHGHLQHPYWFADWVTEHGWSHETILASMGLIAALFVLLILFSHRSALNARKDAWLPLPIWKARKAGCLLLLICMVIGIVAVLASWVVSPLPMLPVPEIPPPQSNLPGSPPPPPAPQVMAFVQFESEYLPTTRLAAYYFRERVFSQLVGLEMKDVAAQADGYPSEAWRSFAAGAPPLTSTSNLIEVTKSERILHSQVFLVQKADRPFALIQGITWKPLEPPTGFLQAYETTSLRLLPSQDLDLGDRRQRLRSPIWSDLENRLYTAKPSESNTVHLVEDILQGLPEEQRIADTRRVRVVCGWLNTNMAFSAKAGVAASTNSITEFLFRSHVGGSHQFALAGVLMLRTAGIPARLASGYRYPLGQNDSTRSNLKLTDAHADTWAEVFVDGGGWLPLPFQPSKILDRPSPQEDPEVEHQLERKIEAATLPSPRPTERPAWLLGALFSVALLPLATLLLWNRWVYHWSLLCQPSRAAELALRAALSMAATAGWRRKPHETYADFALRVERKQGASRFGKQLGKVLSLWCEAYNYKKHQSPEDRRLWTKAVAELRHSLMRDLLGQTYRHPWAGWPSKTGEPSRRML